MDLVQFLRDFADWLQTLSPAGIYAVLFLVAYVENLIPPFPGDVNVVIGGYLVGLGVVGFAGALAVVSVGSTLGFMTMYAAGKALGDAAEDPNRLRWIPKNTLLKAKTWLQRWGYWLVAMNRFLSGTRAGIALVTGASDLRPVRSFGLALLSAVAWYALLLYAGFTVGNNWEAVLPLLDAYGRVVLIILFVVSAILVGRWWLRSDAASPQKNGEDQGA